MTTKLNNFSLLALLFFFILGVACEKIEDLIRFSFQDSTEITIPAQNFIGTGFITIPTPEVQSSSRQAYENNKTQAKYVKEANLKELQLSITAPEEKTFSFLNEIKIYISAPNQPEVLLAQKINIPNTIGNVLGLDETNVNLKPYLQGDSYTLRTEVKLDELLSQEVKIRADMQIGVAAEVF